MAQVTCREARQGPRTCRLRSAHPAPRSPRPPCTKADTPRRMRDNQPGMPRSRLCARPGASEARRARWSYSAQGRHPHRLCPARACLRRNSSRLCRAFRLRRARLSRRRSCPPDTPHRTHTRARTPAQQLPPGAPARDRLRSGPRDADAPGPTAAALEPAHRLRAPAAASPAPRSRPRRRSGPPAARRQPARVSAGANSRCTREPTPRERERRLDPSLASLERRSIA